MQKFSYHCHTTFSDGGNTIEQMIAQAVELGWEEIAITDHLAINEHCPQLSNFEDKLAVATDHVKLIHDAAQAFPIKVYAGFEVDFYNYPGWLEGFKTFKAACGADFYHTGNHYLVSPDYTEVYSIVHLKKQFGLNNYHPYFVRHFETLRDAVLSKEFAFLAHLDYARWGGNMQDGEYKAQIMEIVEALAQTGTAVELNTKGLEFVNDFYPSQWILKELKIRKIPLVINDDAHNTAQLGRYFDQAESMLKDIGYIYRWRMSDYLNN